MTDALDTIRVVRIFVSSPGDVASERAQLDDVVAAINRTQAPHHRVRYELHRWERDVVPRLGPAPQTVVNAQSPDCDVFLGIMWGRFGTRTEGHGSGTEEELRAALSRWEQTGAPWILFYFREDPPAVKTAEQSRQHTQVLELREELSTRGIIGTYQGLNAGSESFVRKADEHLRLLLQQFAPRQAVPRDAVPHLATGSELSLVPPPYREWLSLDRGTDGERKADVVAAAALDPEPLDRADEWAPARRTVTSAMIPTIVKALAAVAVIALVTLWWFSGRRTSSTDQADAAAASREKPAVVASERGSPSLSPQAPVAVAKDIGVASTPGEGAADSRAGLVQVIGHDYSEATYSQRQSDLHKQRGLRQLGEFESGKVIGLMPMGTFAFADVLDIVIRTHDDASAFASVLVRRFSTPDQFGEYPFEVQALNVDNRLLLGFSSEAGSAAVLSNGAKQVVLSARPRRNFTTLVAVNFVKVSRVHERLVEASATVRYRVLDLDLK